MTPSLSLDTIVVGAGMPRSLAAPASRRPRKAGRSGKSARAAGRAERHARAACARRARPAAAGRRRPDRDDPPPLAGRQPARFLPARPRRRGRLQRAVLERASRRPACRAARRRARPGHGRLPVAVLGGIAVRGPDACGPDGATVVDGGHALARGSRRRGRRHSLTLRHALLGDDAPHYSGDDAYRALIDVDAIDPHSPVFEIVKEPQVTIWLSPAGTRSITARERRLLNLVVIVPGDGSTRESWSSKGDRATLEAGFDGWDPRLVGLIRCASDLSRWSLHDRQPLTRWVWDSVCLLGDACHPMLPYQSRRAGARGRGRARPVRDRPRRRTPSAPRWSSTSACGSTAARGSSSRRPATAACSTRPTARATGARRRAKSRRADFKSYH